MKYNIYLKTKTKTENRFDLTLDQIYIIVDAFEKGRVATIDGKQLHLTDVLELKIFEYSETQIDYNRFLTHCMREKLTEGITIGPEHLTTLGKEVTPQFLKDGLKSKDQDQNTPYVTLERLDQIRTLKSTEFDFAKLIRLIEELNYANSKSMDYSKGMLLRSIIDHVPPIFGFKDFRQVTANYSSAGNGKSFKGISETLLKFKDSGDSILHSQIRKTEALIEPTQVNFQGQLDALLQEIVRLTNEKAK